MPEFAERLFETPDRWGNETYYVEHAELERLSRSLNEMLDWNTSPDEAREWDLIGEIDSYRAVYKLGHARDDLYGIFERRGGEYTMLHGQFGNPPRGFNGRRAPMSREAAMEYGRQWLE